MGLRRDQEHGEQGSGCSYKRDPWLSDGNGSIPGQRRETEKILRGEGGRGGEGGTEGGGGGGGGVVVAREVLTRKKGMCSHRPDLAAVFANWLRFGRTTQKHERPKNLRSSFSQTLFIVLKSHFFFDNFCIFCLFASS